MSPRDGVEEGWELDPEDLTLHEKVGAGCTAEVFRGTHRQFGEVAVKAIDWSKTSVGQKEMRAFDREVAIMKRTAHENLVRFLGVASLTRPFRIVTEFCSGGCLFELLHNHEEIDLTWRQQLKMCSDVADAMHYLHSFRPQIIHRDLKSLNLLLLAPVLGPRDHPIVKVSDFGLSRMKDAGGDWGKMTIAAGTCHWMAPEVLIGSSYDERVDVYSFAMIIFEVICREIPFEDEEPSAVGRLTVQGKRPDEAAVPPECPEQLMELMKSCWAHDPRTRPNFEMVVRLLRTIPLPGEGR